MLSLKWVLVAALAVAVVQSRVAPKGRGRRLADVAGKTLCPMDVHIDRNELRIPRYIKFVTCAAHKECEVERPAQECCRLTGQVARECVQVDEYVPVRHLLRNGSWTDSTMPVPVGCSCMVVPTHQPIVFN